MAASIAGATGALFILILMLAPKPCPWLDGCAWFLLAIWGFSRWQDVDDKNPFVMAFYICAIPLIFILGMFRNGLEAILNFIFSPSFHLLEVLLCERSLLALIVIYFCAACFLLKKERDELKEKLSESLKKYQQNLEIVIDSKEQVERRAKNN